MGEGAEGGGLKKQQKLSERPKYSHALEFGASGGHWEPSYRIPKHLSTLLSKTCSSEPQQHIPDECPGCRRRAHTSRNSTHTKGFLDRSSEAVVVKLTNADAVGKEDTATKR
jgi:hypothetical protein